MFSAAAELGGESGGIMSRGGRSGGGMSRGIESSKGLQKEVRQSIDILRQNLTDTASNMRNSIDSRSIHSDDTESSHVGSGGDKKSMDSDSSGSSDIGRFTRVTDFVRDQAARPGDATNKLTKKETEGKENKPFTMDQYMKQQRRDEDRHHLREAKLAFANQLIDQGRRTGAEIREFGKG